MSQLTELQKQVDEIHRILVPSKSVVLTYEEKLMRERIIMRTRLFKTNAKKLNQKV